MEPKQIMQPTATTHFPQMFIQITYPYKGQQGKLSGVKKSLKDKLRSLSVMVGSGGALRDLPWR